MTNKNVFDKLVDITIYAPIGFIKLASDAVSHASEVGKATYESKTHMAKAVGKMAAEFGSKQVQAQASTAIKQIKDKISSSVINTGVNVASKKNVTQDDNSESVIQYKKAKVNPNKLDIDNGNKLYNEDLNLESSKVDVSDLGISSYDTLAASQVISRLDNLPKEQLSKIFEYERSHRKRRTVLAKLESILV